MSYAKSLRVIGQSLEVAKLRVFELHTDGPNYILSSDSLSRTGEWILRHALGRDDLSDQRAPQSTVSRVVSFGQSDISRLDDQAQKLRRNDSSPHTETYSRLSQLLRTLGDHLDRTQVGAFHISWTADSVSVDFQSLDGQSDSRRFTTEKLQQLGSHSRFRRSSGTRFVPNPDSLKHTRPRIR
jgi:hypothetical protein